MHVGITMPTLKSTVLMLAIIGGFMSLSLAQENQAYISIEYMKVKDGQAQSYLEAEQMWKKLHEVRKAEGHILEWNLCRVIYPQGSERPYDYVTITVYPNYKALNTSFSLDLIKKAHPDGDPSAMMEKTSSSRDLVKGLLLQSSEILPPLSEDFDTKFIQIDYMKTPEMGEGAYLAVERDIWKKIHAQRQKAGKLGVWGVYSVMYPYGANEEFNMLTANFFANWTQTGMGLDMSDAEKAGINMDMEEVSEKTLASRSLVKSELWERIEKVN
ncbi:MAG: hypothetical protein AAF696_25425 [Bacteroidota bacterium]